MFELRLYKNMHYVQILYKDSDELPEPMYIPGCGKSCPLRKMYMLYSNSLPAGELDVECAQPIETQNTDNIVIPLSEQNSSISKSSAVGKVNIIISFRVELQL